MEALAKGVSGGDASFNWPGKSRPEETQVYVGIGMEEMHLLATIRMSTFHASDNSPCPGNETIPTNKDYSDPDWATRSDQAVRGLDHTPESDTSESGHLPKA